MSRVMSVVCRCTVVLLVYGCTELFLVFCCECDAVTLLPPLSALCCPGQALLISSKKDYWDDPLIVSVSLCLQLFACVYLS